MWLIILGGLALVLLLVRRLLREWNPARCLEEGHVERYWRRVYWREPMSAFERFDAVLVEVTEKRGRCRRCRQWLEPNWDIESQESYASVSWPKEYWDELKQHEARVRVTSEGWV